MVSTIKTCLSINLSGLFLNCKPKLECCRAGWNWCLGAFLYKCPCFFGLLYLAKRILQAVCECHSQLKIVFWGQWLNTERNHPQKCSSGLCTSSLINVNIPVLVQIFHLVNDECQGKMFGKEWEQEESVASFPLPLHCFVASLKAGSFFQNVFSLNKVHIYLCFLMRL